MRRGHLAHGDWGYLLRDPWVPVVFQFLGLKSFTFPNSSIISVAELFALFLPVYLRHYFNSALVAVLCIPSVCAAYLEGTFFFSSLYFFFFIIRL